jgi:hypothetical protein
VTPHALEPSLSGPAVPDFLGDLLERATETLGESLFGASIGLTGGPTPVTFLSDLDRLAELKAELQEKLLQIREFEGRSAGLEPAAF